MNEGEVSVDPSIVEILQKDKHKRSNEEIDILYLFFSHMNFFIETRKKYGEEVVRNVCRCLLYHEFQKEEYIFKLGDVGNNCYVLIKGTIEVLSPGMVKTDHGKTWDMVRVALLPSGIIFGDKSIIDRKRRYKII